MVTGFEPVDILQGICMLVQMVVEDRPAIDNAYRRGVNADGNPVARQLVEQVFEPCDTTWRGWGRLPTRAFTSAPSSRALMPVPALTCRRGDGRAAWVPLRRRAARGHYAEQLSALWPHLHARTPRRPVHGELRGQLCGVLPLP